MGRAPANQLDEKPSGPAAKNSPARAGTWNEAGTACLHRPCTCRFYQKVPCGKTENHQLEKRVWKHLYSGLKRQPVCSHREKISAETDSPVRNQSPVFSGYL